jgi:hypothetical protein
MRFAAVFLAALLAAGCQSESTDQSGPGGVHRDATDATPQMAEQTPMNSPVPPEKDDPAARPPIAQSAEEVQLLEYRIQIPETLAAGKSRFRVENAGHENHALEIEGNGIEAKTAILSRGNVADLEVDLKPGTYTVYCPVAGHAEKGMKKTITVR